MPRIPYREIDPNIVALVRVLNAFPTVTTIGSCGGHVNPGPCQAAEGSWDISFTVTHNEDGWLDLEFLTWVINGYEVDRGQSVRLEPYAPPPYLNEPGRCLRFVLAGWDGCDPHTIAKDIRRLRRHLHRR